MFLDGNSNHVKQMCRICKMVQLKAGIIMETFILGKLRMKKELKERNTIKKPMEHMHSLKLYLMKWEERQKKQV